MEQYISKSALVAEIERRKNICQGVAKANENNEFTHLYYKGKTEAYSEMQDILNTLEVKEVDEKFECPTIKVKDDASVSSRMQYIDDELKPIAEFIMEYSSWNLHKEEWNHPVLEVPLFRVLDALIQRGKPYCCGG